MGLNRLPFHLRSPQLRVGNQEMPDESLERFSVWRNGRGIDDGNEHTSIGDLGGEATITSYDATNRSAYASGMLESAHQVGADVLPVVAAADGKNHHHVRLVESRAAKPVRITGVPSFIVNARSQFRDVIGRCVSLYIGDLAKIADGVRGVPRTSSDTDEK